MLPVKPAATLLPVAPKATSLIDRLGFGKMYTPDRDTPLSASGNFTQLHFETLPDAEAEPPRTVQFGDRDRVRPCALLLHGEPISKLSTQALFAWTAAFDIRPKGIEWIDDRSCVLVFATDSEWVSAWQILANINAEDVPTVPLGDARDPLWFGLMEAYLVFLPARKCSKTLRDELKLKDEPELLKPMWIRPALEADIKKNRAAEHSEFYAQRPREKRRSRSPERSTNGLPTRPRAMHRESEPRGSTYPNPRTSNSINGRISSHNHSPRSNEHSRNNSKRSKLTAEELDAEMEAYSRSRDELPEVQ